MLPLKIQLQFGLEFTNSSLVKMDFLPYIGSTKKRIPFYRAEEYKTIKTGIIDEHSVSIILPILPKILFEPFQPGFYERPLFE